MYIVEKTPNMYQAKLACDKVVARHVTNIVNLGLTHLKYGGLSRFSDSTYLSTKLLVFGEASTSRGMFHALTGASSDCVVDLKRRAASVEWHSVMNFVRKREFMFWN